MSEELAREFHETYERLAPSFKYETRPDTREFDPESRNGRLMIEVCSQIFTPSKKRIAALEEWKIKAMQHAQNAAFYRCCALSGEVPTEGSEPYPEGARGMSDGWEFLRGVMDDLSIVHPRKTTLKPIQSSDPIRGCLHGYKLGRCPSCNLIEAEKTIAALRLESAQAKHTIAEQQAHITALEAERVEHSLESEDGNKD